MQVLQYYLNNTLRNFNYVIYSVVTREAIIVDPYDIEAIKAAKTALETVAQGIAQKAYQKAQQEQQAQSTDTNEDNTSNDDNTVDAEFEAKD